MCSTRKFETVLVNYSFNIKTYFVFRFKDAMELLIVLIILMKTIVLNVMAVQEKLFHVIRSVSLIMNSLNKRKQSI